MQVDQEVQESKRTSAGSLKSPNNVKDTISPFMRKEARDLTPNRKSSIPVRTKNDALKESAPTSSEPTETDESLSSTSGLQPSTPEAKTSAPIVSEDRDSPTDTSIFDIHDEAKILSMLKAKPSLDREVSSVSGKTVLHHACESSFAPLVNYLLRRQVDIDTQDSFGMTPLHYCTNENIVRLLWYNMIIF